MQQYYVIVSRMHGLALDVQGANRNAGAQVVPWNKSGNENQLWYDDHATGTIRSKLNGFCLDIEGVSEKNYHITRYKMTFVSAVFNILC